jgi:hypothetical protein
MVAEITRSLASSERLKEKQTALGNASVAGGTGRDNNWMQAVRPDG